MALMTEATEVEHHDEEDSEEEKDLEDLTKEDPLEPEPKVQRTEEQTVTLNVESEATDVVTMSEVPEMARSMIEDMITDGDLVIVESRNETRNGETVVALVGGSDATLKRFYLRGDRVSLVPANSSMDPIEVPAREVEIRGVLRGLLRSY